MELIKTIPLFINLNDADIWFQDEARFGQQNTTTRIWAKKELDRGQSNNNSLIMRIYLALYALQRGIQKHSLHQG
ncbi:hypothetical protein WLQ65_18915 [Pseudoalteromonas piscicida]|uniref:hypothetical protein n=1 Tax=Pseudoalteromonas piscicida TaxID=43662 RepID=UPI0030C93C47